MPFISCYFYADGEWAGAIEAAAPGVELQCKGAIERGENLVQIQSRAKILSPESFVNHEVCDFDLLRSPQLIKHHLAASQSQQ
ncbi:hypothetical protein [Egbenema bharatensis]|uniref:hypothetical protein n=1 Tax=Egbenema bharatensis TaxID=3463334 RepID=UPI003A883A41